MSHVNYLILALVICVLSFKISIAKPLFNDLFIFYFRLYQIRVNLRKFLLFKTVRNYLTWSRDNTENYQNKPNSHYIVQILWTFSVSILAQFMLKYPRSISSPREYKKYSTFYWEHFWVSNIICLCRWSLWMSH